MPSDPNIESELITKSAHIACTNCDEFEFEKSYTGRKGTPAENEYEQIQFPETCIVCAGELEITKREDGT